MRIDIDRLDTLIARGVVRQGDWGDGRVRACLMSAIVAGAKSEADCAAQGWPLWLAEMVVWLFDGYPADQAISRGRALMGVIKAADDAGRDWDAVYRRVRLDAILPIAMESIGDGDEPWRQDCRRVVQWSIENGGKAAKAADAAWAAWGARAARGGWAARAADAAGAAVAAGAPWAAEAAGAAVAAGAPWAAWASGEAAARDRIEAALIAACG